MTLALAMHSPARLHHHRHHRRRDFATTTSLGTVSSPRGRVSGVGDVDSGGAGLCEGDQERAAKGEAGEDGELAVKDVESVDGHGAGHDGTQREEPGGAEVRSAASDLNSRCKVSIHGLWGASRSGGIISRGVRGCSAANLGVWFRSVIPAHTIVSSHTIHPWMNRGATGHGLKDKSGTGDGSACNYTTPSFAESESSASVSLECHGEGYRRWEAAGRASF
jgi:hypothetical protein